MLHNIDPKAHVAAALCGLVVLNLLMLGALFASVPPHPPAAVAPYIGATTAVTVFAVALTLLGANPVGAPLLAIALNLVSFGPHKFFTEAAPQIAPALVAGHLFAATVVFGLWRQRAARQA